MCTLYTICCNNVKLNLITFILMSVGYVLIIVIKIWMLNLIFKYYLVLCRWGSHILIIILKNSNTNFNNNNNKSNQVKFQVNTTFCQSTLALKKVIIKQVSKVIRDAIYPSMFLHVIRITDLAQTNQNTFSHKMLCLERPIMTRYW